MEPNQPLRAWILDVGHGNATVIEAAAHVVIIDGGRGNTLKDFLIERDIRHIDAVIVSHADADHFGGISILLSNPNFEVKKVFVNPDSRDADLWEDFDAVMKDATERGTEFSLELTNVSPAQLVMNGIYLEVMAPSQNMAYRTTDARVVNGARLTANTMSAVIRLWTNDSPRLLVAGDIDQPGLDSMLESNHDIRAEVLIFPHHGGRPGAADPIAFTNSLVKSVDADLVVFSIGRNKYKNPRPEIVDVVLRNKRGVHIACTQLSTYCASELPEENVGLSEVLASGAAQNSCCAGTIEIVFTADIAYVPSRATHLGFIRRHAPTALCLRGARHIE